MMKNFLSFKLLTEAFSPLSKDEFMNLVKNPGETLAHFSNSETFPFETNLRGFASAFNADVVGSKLGISVLKPKDALFFWFLRDVKFPNAIGPLWQKRTYAYLVDCPEGSGVFRVSRYMESDYEKDIQRLKEKGYNFLTSKLPLELQSDILNQIEFGKMDLALPRNLVEFKDRLELLWLSKGKQFSNYFENTKYGPAKVRTITLDIARKLIFTAVGIKLGYIPSKNLEKNERLPDSFITWYTTCKSFPVSIPGEGSSIILSDLLNPVLDLENKKSINVEETLKTVTSNLDFSTLASKLKLTPDQYIEAMNTFIHSYYSIYRKGETMLDVNHPAWKLWLTILFFSTDKKESWKNIWLSLGYKVIIDDDPRTQITPGLEQMMIANMGQGIERQLIRLDNERSEVLVLDPGVLKNIRRFTLSELQPQESE